jgi:hypothetical protein
MTYMNDRQRVEALLLPIMLLDVLLAGVSDPNHEDAKATKAFLSEASNAPLAGLVKKERDKVARRMVRVHQEVMAPYRREEMRADKVGLITYFLLKSVTECDYLVLSVDDPLQKALDLFLPALTPSAEIEPLLVSARKAARKVLDHFQTLGYFDGVPFAP